MPYAKRYGGPKARGPAASKAWARKTRTYTRTKAEALKGVRLGVRKAPSVHKFTRWGPTLELYCTDAGGGIFTASCTDTSAGTAAPNVTLSSATADTGGGGQFGGGVEFRLSDVPDVNDFTHLFDHYTIEQIDIEISQLQNSAAVGGSGGGTQQAVMATLNYTPDFDDSAAPANQNEIYQYQRMKQWTFRGSGTPLKFAIKPRTALTVYQTGITSAYAAGGENTSVNVAYPDVPHYGFKFWLNNLMGQSGPGVGGILRMKCKYHFSFVDPK